MYGNVGERMAAARVLHSTEWSGVTRSTVGDRKTWASLPVLFWRVSLAALSSRAAAWRVIFGPLLRSRHLRRPIGDLLSLSAKTRILQTRTSTNRMRTLMIYLYLTGVHPTSVHLMGGCPIGVYLTGMCLLGVYLIVVIYILIDVYLTGVHLIGRVPHKRASHRRAPHGHAYHGRAPHGRVPHTRTPSWPCTS